MFAFTTPWYSLAGAVRPSRVLCSPIRGIQLYPASTQACAQVSREDVEKTARLAQLDLSEEEITKVTPEFQKIIGFIDRMSELDVEGVEPMARPHDAQNVMRGDSPVPFPNVDDIMREAPAVERDFVRVPKISSEGTD